MDIGQIFDIYLTLIINLWLNDVCVHYKENEYYFKI